MDLSWGLVPCFSLNLEWHLFLFALVASQSCHTQVGLQDSCSNPERDDWADEVAASRLLTISVLGCGCQPCKSINLPNKRQITALGTHATVSPLVVPASLLLPLSFLFFIFFIIFRLYPFVNTPLPGDHGLLFYIAPSLLKRSDYYVQKLLT